MRDYHLRLRDLRRSNQPDGRFELTRSPIRIGCGPRCEIRLHERDLSDVQVILRLQNNQWSLHPVGPAAGCLINTSPLNESRVLSVNDTFQIGQVSFQLLENSVHKVKPLTPENPQASLEKVSCHADTLTASEVTNPTSRIQESAVVPIAVQSITPVSESVAETTNDHRASSDSILSGMSEVNSNLQTSQIRETDDCTLQNTAKGKATDSFSLSQSHQYAIAHDRSSDSRSSDRTRNHSVILKSSEIVYEELGNHRNPVPETPVPRLTKPVSSHVIAVSDSHQKPENSKHLPLKKMRPEPVASATSIFFPAVEDSEFRNFTTNLRNINPSHNHPNAFQSLSDWAADYARRRTSGIKSESSSELMLASEFDSSEMVSSMKPNSPMPQRTTYSNLFEPSILETGNMEWASHPIPVLSDPKPAVISTDDSSVLAPTTEFSSLNCPENQNAHNDSISHDSLVAVSPVAAIPSDQTEIEILQNPETPISCSIETSEKSDRDAALIPLESTLLTGTGNAETASLDLCDTQKSVPVCQVAEQGNHAEPPVQDDPESHTEIELHSDDQIGCDSEQSMHPYGLGISDYLTDAMEEILDHDSESTKSSENFSQAPDQEPTNANHFDFDQWLLTVGPILHSASLESESMQVVPDSGSEHDSIQPVTELEPESVEILIPKNLSEESLSEQNPGESITSEESRQPHSDCHFSQTLTDPSLMQPLALEEPLKAEVGRESVSTSGAHQEWPSVHEILKWSANRETSPNCASTEAEDASRSQVDSLSPHQFLRINLPVAILMCSVLAMGSIAMAGIAWKIGYEENLTQSAISAALISEKAGTVPRLPVATIQKLAGHRPWWQISADQLWWRATFMKLREDGGLESAESSVSLAERAFQSNPIEPSARLWKAFQENSPSEEILKNSLSRDVLSLTMQADHFRRIGEEKLAADADRQALTMATSSEQLFRYKKVHFDSDLGTQRFLLPGQFAVLTILKRLLKEPDPNQAIRSVLPANNPLVDLTAAQILQQNGLGDVTDLISQLLKSLTESNQPASENQLLNLAVRAEALALNRQMTESTTAYKQLTQMAPNSDWSRSWLFNLGELQSRNQLMDDALLSWRKARGEDPNHQVDRHAIQASRSFASSSPGSGVSNSATRLRAN